MLVKITTHKSLDSLYNCLGYLASTPRIYLLLHSSSLLFMKSSSSLNVHFVHSSPSTSNFYDIAQLFKLFISQCTGCDDFCLDHHIVFFVSFCISMKGMIFHFWYLFLSFNGIEKSVSSFNLKRLKSYFYFNGISMFQIF